MSILIDCGTNFKQGLMEITSLYPDIEKVYSFVLKLDVEGAEYQILKDMEKSNIFNKIKKLHVEFHEWGRNPEYDDNRYWTDYFSKNKIDYVSTGMMV